MNKVITKDYPENLSGGVMVCGINYGYSSADEQAENAGGLPASENLSFFSDQTVRKTDRFRKRVLTWLDGWGFPLACRPGEEHAFERSFFQCNWLDTQSRGTSGLEKITVEDLVRDSKGFVDLLAAREPSVVFLFGSSLIEALNDTRVRDKVVRALGPRTAPQRVVAELLGYSGRSFSVRVQSFGETAIVGCPHPQSRGLSDIYMAAIELPDLVRERLHSRK